METNNSNTIWGQTLEEFCNSASSSSPTPGGGSVSVVTARLGFSLVLMAMEITLKKDYNESLYNWKNKLSNNSELIKTFADKDIDVFNQFMIALKLPKSNDEEKIIRIEAVQKALIEATLCPLDTANIILDSMRITENIIPMIKQDVMSDISAGFFIMYSSLKAVLLNVSINLPSLKSETLKSDFKIRKENILKESSLISENCLNHAEFLS